MKIGLALTHHFAPTGQDRVSVGDLMRQVALAEELGFESIFLGHHYLTRSSFLQPLSVAAYIAARTSRIRIGFGVYLLPLLNPLAVAEELATLDVLSEGRVIAGFGSGYRKAEFRAFGVDFAERHRLLAAYVSTIQQLWQGEAVTAIWAGGELKDARILLQAVQPGGPPIWFGAFTELGIRRAARLGVTWLAPPAGSLRELEAFLDVYRAALPPGKAQPVEQPLLREGFVASTRELAIERCRPHLERQYADYRAWKHHETIETLIAERTLVGSPESVRDQLIGYWEAGFGHVIVRTSWMGLPATEALESLRLLGTEVLETLPQALGDGMATR